MVQLIRNRTIGGVLLGLIILAASKMMFDMMPESPNVTYTPLFHNIKKIISGNQVIEIAASVIFVILQAVLFTYLLQVHKVIKERTYFPFLIYILIALVYNEQHYLNPTSFLNFFLLLITERMLRLQESGKKPGLLFLDIGTIIGISIIFSKETIYFIPAVLIGILIIFSYDISNFFILFLSLLMVIIIASGMYFLSGLINEFVDFFTFTPINFNIVINHWQERFYILLLILFFLVLFTYLYFQFISTAVSNKAKRFAGVFLVFWITTILIVIVQEVNLWYNMALFAIPASVFSANYFQENKGSNWLKNIVFLLFILGIISIQLNY